MKFFASLTLLALTAMTAQAAIRVYNPDTGTTEAAPSLKSGEAPAAPNITIKPETEPRRQVQPILLPEEEEAAEAANQNYPLGEIFFFVDMRQYTPDLGEAILNFQKVSGLKIEAYMESKNPKEYAKDMIMLQRTTLANAERDVQRMANLPKLTADGRGQAFAYHRPGGWHKAVYYDGTGSKRAYDLKYDMDKLTRHINRMSRKLKSGGAR